VHPGRIYSQLRIGGLPLRWKGKGSWERGRGGAGRGRGRVQGRQGRLLKGIGRLLRRWVWLWHSPCRPLWPWRAPLASHSHPHASQSQSQSQSHTSGPVTDPQGQSQSQSQSQSKSLSQGQSQSQLQAQGQSQSEGREGWHPGGCAVWGHVCYGFVPFFNWMVSVLQTLSVTLLGYTSVLTWSFPLLSVCIVVCSQPRTLPSNWIVSDTVRIM